MKDTGTAAGLATRQGLLLTSLTREID